MLLLGDSITQGWQSKSKSIIWKNYFGIYRTANFGIGGDRTHEIHWRLENGGIGKLRPKLIILLAGANNLAYRESTEMILQSFVGIIDLLQEVTPRTRILMLGILPTGSQGSRLRRQVSEVNNGLKKLAGSRGLIFLDLDYPARSAAATLGP